MIRFFSVLTICFFAVVASSHHVRGHGETLIQIANVTRQIESATNNAALLYLRRGELYREHQDWKAAEADYAHAQALDPNLKTVDFYRAGMLADSGRLRPAQTLLNQVIKENPTSGEAFVSRARVAVKLGEDKTAVADYKRGLKLLQQPEPEHFLESAQAQVKAGRVDDALTDLDAGIKRFGPIISLQGYAVDLELRRKNTDGAIARLDSFMPLATRKESWLAQRGDILLAAGRNAEARKSYKAALKSIDLLPRRLQQSPSMVDLQTRMHASLAHLPPTDVSEGTSGRE